MVSLVKLAIVDIRQMSSLGWIHGSTARSYKSYFMDLSAGYDLVVRRWMNAFDLASLIYAMIKDTPYVMSTFIETVYHKLRVNFM